MNDLICFRIAHKVIPAAVVGCNFYILFFAVCDELFKICNGKGAVFIIRKAVYIVVNCSPSSRQLKKYKFFLPAEIYLLAVFMQLASKFHVFPLVSKFQDSFANVCCCSNLYNLRSFLREYFYQ